MRKLTGCIALAVLLGACTAAPPPPPPTATPAPRLAGTIVALGDSLTAGQGVDESDAYPAQLQRRLEKDGFPWQVINAGLSGETSTAARGRVDWVMRLKPQMVIVETGGNDGLRGIDPKLTENNLRAIVGSFKQRGVKVVVAGMTTEENLGGDYAKRFAALYPRVAKAEGVPLIDHFLQGVAANPKLNQADRIHPTAEGYAVVVEHLAPQIEGLLKP